MPETTYAATLPWLPSPAIRPPIMMKMAEPTATSPFVLSPVMRCRHWRSSPIAPPRKSAANIRIPKSIQFTVLVPSATSAPALPGAAALAHAFPNAPARSST
jgi:hypothetical protein